MGLGTYLGTTLISTSSLSQLPRSASKALSSRRSSLEICGLGWDCAGSAQPGNRPGKPQSVYLICRNVACLRVFSTLSLGSSSGRKAAAGRGTTPEEGSSAIIAGGQERRVRVRVINDSPFPLPAVPTINTTIPRMAFFAANSPPPPAPLSLISSEGLAPPQPEKKKKRTVLRTVLNEWRPGGFPRSQSLTYFL